MWSKLLSVPGVAALNVSLLSSPQSTVTNQGSSSPGSEKEPRSKEVAVASSAIWSDGAVMLGATLFTVTLAVESVTPPSLSLIFPPTARVPSSAVGQVAMISAPNPP